jgi:hypothetical protein
MRAHGREGEMGKRLAIVIGVAAAGVMALGAQTAAAAPDVVKYDTKLTITHEGHHSPHCGEPPPKTSRRPSCVLWHGGVESQVRKCMEGRRVTFFKQLPGADRTIATMRSVFRPDYGEGIWGWLAPTVGRVYAKVRREVHDEFVCRGDRSATI